MERHFFFTWMHLFSLVVLAERAVCQNAIEIYSLRVDCKVTSRFAHTVITSRVANRANESKEALFEVELPKTAFITNFSMTIDGETYPGIVKEKKSAEDQYVAAVSRGQSAGLVKSTGRKLEQFHVSVNVAAASKVTFELIYEELLKRKLGKYELLLKVRPKQLVKHFQIDTHIFEPQGISFLETESTFITNELSNALKTEKNETKAHISFKPTITQQRKSPELEETLLDGDLLIRYDVKRSVTAGDIQIVNGYFVHYFAPREMQVFPKNVIFVIDKSGSMEGKKIQQTREALQKILKELKPEDHFNLVVFSGDVTKWKPSLLPATEENVEQAQKYVQSIEDDGVTNINSAVLTAIKALDKDIAAELLPEKSVSIIILLTDGDPTTGETNIGKIQANIKEANKGKYFLYCLGFGFDVSYSFLEKMALGNGGVARRIYEDSDAALQLQGFYREVAMPILKDIEVQYLTNDVLEVTQNTFQLLFDGSEIVVAGKVGNELDVLSVEIKAHAVTSDLTLKEETNVTEKERVFQHQRYIFGNFVERLWAYLTIHQLLEKSISAGGEQRKTLDAQALNLSLKFSFVTPLTSMVVTKPDAQEVANKPTEADNENGGGPYAVPNQSTRMSAADLSDPLLGPSARRVSAASPGAGFQPEDMDLLLYSPPFDYYDAAIPLATTIPPAIPHFILQLPHETDTVCLNINSPKEIPINLVTDPDKGIEVTGKLGENGKFVQFEIVFQKLDMRINISKEETVVNDRNNMILVPWNKATSFTVHGLNISVEKEKSLSLFGPDNIIFKISYVKFPEYFLGLYFMGGENFSNKVSGPLGQFYFNTHVDKSISQSPGARKTIVVQGQQHHATGQDWKDYRVEATDGNVFCWKVDITV